jgi:putative oxidoreductase
LVFPELAPGEDILTMKIVSHIARVLLGLIFTVFGLNGFLHFIPLPLPSGVAGQFMGAVFASHYYVAVFAVQVAGGILLLSDRYVPLALALLGPVIVNILLFHALMAPDGLPMAVIVAALWSVLFSRLRSAFAGLFQQKFESQASAEPMGVTALSRAR